jgi:hypothetical protein
VGAERGAIDVSDVIERIRRTSFYVDDDLLVATFGPWLSR